VTIMLRHTAPRDDTQTLTMGPGPSLLCCVSFRANTGYAWDFIESLYAEMANRLSRAGVSTIVAYPAIETRPVPLSQSTAVPASLETNFTSLRGAITFWRFVRRERIRVVYLTDRSARSFQYALMRLFGVRRVIVHDHTSGERQQATGMRRLLKLAFARLPWITADKVVAVSDYVARRHATVTMLSPRRICRVWNGIDTAAIESMSPGPDIREMLGVASDRLVVACACRSTPGKGVDVLFRAFDKLVQEWPTAEPPVLAYIGAGPQLSYLKTLQSSLVAHNEIYLLGFVRGAAELLRSADLIVVPSIWQEAFGLSVLEMMARRKAIIATRVGGIPEQVIDGVTGLLVDPGDVGGLCTAIGYLLANPDIRRKLGDGAFKRAKSEFILSDQINAMIDTFSSVLR